MQHVVVVGAGQGGVQAAASLRQEGFSGSITLFGDEPGLPYQRPPLSKAYMADGAAERLVLRPASFFERSGIDYREGQRVERIDRDKREVSLSGGESLGFDHLILATGAVNWRPPIAGLDAVGVLQLRTLVHAESLRTAMMSARRAIVIGGGFIGLEFAAMARNAGVEVTVVEAAPRLMGRAVSPAMSQWFLDVHRVQGTRVMLGTPVMSILGDPTGRASTVVLSDGRHVDGDIVLLAAGARPAVELAEQAGLNVQDGILVNGQLLTSDPAISALGDCARFPLPGIGSVRLESVQAAVDHARYIGRRLAKGEVADYDTTPWFWSDQGKSKLQIAGLGTNADHFEQIETPAGDPIVMAFRDDRLVAVETVNAAGPHLAARRLIGTPRMVLAEHGFDLKGVAAAMSPEQLPA